MRGVELEERERNDQHIALNTEGESRRGSEKERGGRRKKNRGKINIHATFSYLSSPCSWLPPLTDASHTFVHLSSFIFPM